MQFSIFTSTSTRHMGESISEWVLARHGTNQISGKVELMFRPFLRWLDRGLERMFTDAAKKVHIGLKNILPDLAAISEVKQLKRNFF